MAVKVIDNIERKEDRKYEFYLPWVDTEVQKMLVKHGHRISLVPDSGWDIALFTGGADICPLLYGEKLHDSSCINVNRDLQEVAFYKTLHKKRMKVGICRGGQLLNVMSGGRLWQDVNNHGDKDGHLVKLWNSDDLVRMSSRHHQMMVPASDAVMLGFARMSTSKISDAFGTRVFSAPGHDPEMLYYEAEHSLCFQPHPEDADAAETTRVFFEMIDYLWNDDYHVEALKDEEW